MPKILKFSSERALARAIGYLIGCHAHKFECEPSHLELRIRDDAVECLREAGLIDIGSRGKPFLSVDPSRSSTEPIFHKTLAEIAKFDPDHGDWVTIKSASGDIIKVMGPVL